MPRERKVVRAMMAWVENCMFVVGLYGVSRIWK